MNQKQIDQAKWNLEILESAIERGLLENASQFRMQGVLALVRNSRKALGDETVADYNEEAYVSFVDLCT